MEDIVNDKNKLFINKNETTFERLCELQNLICKESIQKQLSKSLIEINNIKYYFDIYSC